jgi:hypothetical protein
MTQPRTKVLQGNRRVERGYERHKEADKVDGAPFAHFRWWKTLNVTMTDALRCEVSQEMRLLPFFMTLRQRCTRLDDCALEWAVHRPQPGNLLLEAASPLPHAFAHQMYHYDVDGPCKDGSRSLDCLATRIARPTAPPLPSGR